MSEGIIVSKLQATLVKIKHPFGAGHYSHLGTVKIFFKLQAKLVKHPSPGFAGKLFNYSSYFFWLLFYLFKFFLFGGLLKPESLSKFGGAMAGPSTPLPAFLTGNSFMSNSFESLVTTVGSSVFELSAK